MPIRRAILTRAVVVASLLALAPTACPGGRAQRPGPTSTGATPVVGERGGTLRVAIADDAGALDPQLASEPGAFGLIRATQRGLMAFPFVAGEAGTGPVPDLADAMPAVSPDGLTYTFRLRSGLRLGPPASRALAGADVVAGISRALRLGAVSGALRVIAGADAFVAGRAPSVSGLSAPDERTVRVTLARPANDLLWMLATPAAGAVPPGLGRAVSPRDVPASGPYRLDIWEPGVRMRLVRNAAWSASSDPIRSAYVDAIEVTIGAAEKADLAGEGVRPARPTGNVSGGCLAYLFVNPHIKRFEKAQVRRGIRLALDRTALAGALARANGAPANAAAAILPPGSPSMPGGAVPPADAAEARRMIGAAFETRIGFERRGPDAAGDGAMGEALIRMLGAAGVRATPLLGPGAIGPSAYDLYERGNVPLGVARWCPDWPGRSGRVVLAPLLGTGGTANYSRTSDRELDRRIAAATAVRLSQEPSPKAGPTALDRAWGAAEERALALDTIVPLAFYGEAALVAGRVRGFVAHPLYTRGDPANVWLES